MATTAQQLATDTSKAIRAPRVTSIDVFRGLTMIVMIFVNNLEIGRAHTPWYHWGTTSAVARLVQEFASPELAESVLPGVLTGDIRLCLGYTEPEGGSDIATCKTRAVRDGDQWVINGAKMFTTGAHNCQYVFLITNTDPAAPKHQSLTMFLVPMDAPGVEVQPIRTVDGDRTNITFYTDVRIDDE